ncbi:hypothetical protein O9H85_22445 [Paenibacillus filicis]|uniref:Uncharacterized protein n=1 Tax=Paenibacillus gyeongsangnamensis TaxID=3388067 RepID=A0ABT4QE28_9BACL|nr:hypothetical protein [Paenibacillus filicis]MCZ8515130.1 hypothetical protein [Paenibacillus filicis]
MENISPLGMHKPMPYPNMMPTAVSPMAAGPANIAPMAVGPANIAPMAAAPMMPYPAPVNVHTSYEEINIYAPKKHYFHGYPGWTSVGVILVLYILLVIVLRGLHRF